MTQPSKPSPERAKRSEAEAAGTSPKSTVAGNGPSSADAASTAATDPSGSVAGGAQEGRASAKIVEEAQAVLEGEPIDVEGSSLDDQTAEARAEAAEWQDKFIRLHAEWDTYRRRTAEQREVEKARATEKLVTSLLPVIDDFERTIDYADKNGETGLLDGVKAVRAKLVDVLVKDGVEAIDPQGEAFDALEAQAVATVDDASVPDETVSEVYQKGYKMGTKVLRPAMVTVTTGGPKREAKPEEGKAAKKR